MMKQLTTPEDYVSKIYTYNMPAEMKDLFTPVKAEWTTWDGNAADKDRVLKEIEEGEMAWVDFEGWTLQDSDEPLGKIVRVDDSTMNIFAELEDGRMLPLHEDFIMEIDEEAKVLRVNLPFEL